MRPTYPSPGPAAIRPPLSYCERRTFGPTPYATPFRRAVCRDRQPECGLRHKRSLRLRQRRNAEDQSLFAGSRSIVENGKQPGIVRIFVGLLIERGVVVQV